MFLLVSGRHVGAHTDGHQHVVSINLGKKVIRISRVRKIAVTRILARVFAYSPSFISPDSGLYLSTCFDFYFDLFWIAWHWKPAIPSLVESSPVYRTLFRLLIGKIIILLNLSSSIFRGWGVGSLLSEVVTYGLLRFVGCTSHWPSD